MKSTLAILFSAALGLAAPSVPAPDAFPYRLRVSSPNESFNGKYISTNGSFIGIFRTGPSTPVQVYAVPSSNGLVELRTYPETKDSQTLVLLGKENDDLDLTAVKNPAATTFPRGTTCDWTSFKLTGGNPPAAGRSDNIVTYGATNKGGKFFAFDFGAHTGTAVKLERGGYHISINFPITITYERINFSNADGEYTIQ